MGSTEVYILGQKYSIRGDAPEEYIRELAAYVDKKLKDVTEHLNQCYGEIVKDIRDAESVFIMGPGEAKHELERRMTRSRIRNRIVKIDTADKLTDRPIMAKVRRFFEEKAN